MQEDESGGRSSRRLLRRGGVLLLISAACGLAVLGLLPLIARPPGHDSSSDHTTACTNSDGTACPASYFTGPLGPNNLIPQKTGAFLIEYYAGVGIGWTEAQQAILKRQSDVGRTFDGISIEYGGDGYWDGVYGMYDPKDTHPLREQWIIANGSFPTVNWTPDYTIGQMNRGAADEIWTKAARYWAALAPHRVMLRPFAEMNMPSVYSAVAGSQNGGVDSCGVPFVRAWQRMVKIFRENGASNVGFWFTPEEGGNRGCAVDSYPGDAYVDWVGSDRYNRCTVSESACYSTPLRPGPAGFFDLFMYAGKCADGASCPASMHDTLGPRKPFVVGEVGTVYDDEQPLFKGSFYRSIPKDARRSRYLRGVTFFDADVSALEGPEANWSVDFPLSNPDPFRGFVTMARDPWFSTRHE